MILGYYVRIFNSRSLKLTEISPEDFQLEREMQRLTESNIEIIFGLKFVTSEYELHGLRIDTLGFDEESKAFVIIEYKKDRNFSVVDQGVAYLNLMLNNKADFILEYNEKSDKSLKRDDVDWSQSRVIFVAPEFTKYQQHAIGFKDLGIQLWEIRKYGNGMIVLNEIKQPDSKESISTITKSNPVAKRVTEEIKVYTEDTLIRVADDKIQELYNELKRLILGLGPDIEVRPTKKYVGFRRKQQFAGMIFLSEKIKIYLNIEPGKIIDSLGITRDVTNVGHFSHGDVEVTVTKSSDIPAVLALIKQAYETN